LFINQSAVSRWIQRLETSLNTRLFTRTNHGVELTDHGEFLYAELKPMYEKLSETLQAMRGMYDMTDNILRIGCMDSTEVLRALKHAVRDFEKMCPDILLKIELFSFKDLREQLVCGNLDCIVSYSLGFGEYWNIAEKRFKRLDTYIAVSSQSTLADSMAIPVEKLKNETLYLLYIAEMKDAEKRAIDICRKIGFVPREIKYMPSYFALEMAVKNGRGFSICGENMCDRFRSDIKLYHVKEPYQEQNVILAWRENSCSALVRKFIESIKETEKAGEKKGPGAGTEI
jgi:DNA-binding transcriptional LysR family regulator